MVDDRIALSLLLSTSALRIEGWVPDELRLPSSLEVQTLLPETASRLARILAQRIDMLRRDPDLVPVAVVLDGIGFAGQIGVEPQALYCKTNHGHPTEAVRSLEDPCIELAGGMHHPGRVLGTRNQDIEHNHVDHRDLVYHEHMTSTMRRPIPIVLFSDLMTGFRTPGALAISPPTASACRLRASSLRLLGCCLGLPGEASRRTRMHERSTGAARPVCGTHPRAT